MLQEADAESLLLKAREFPDEADKALSQARILRETIYRIFHAVAQREAPSGEDLENLKEALTQAIASARLAPQEKGFGWDWPFESPSFEQMLWPITQAAVDLLLAENLSQVGQCADERGCGALFIDTSRNHSRQWCSMDTCGNRAKAQRHYTRHKRTGGVTK